LSLWARFSFCALAALSAIAFCTSLSRAREAEKGASVLVPIVFHVAPSERHRSELEPFIESQLAHANETFAPLGVLFQDGGREALNARHAVLSSRADRDALLAYVKRGAVHCMVVQTLMDVDEPGRERRGVHWYKAGTSRPHMVIVSTLAGDYVLAHELGHYLGNPAHSQEPGNLMSYLPGVRPPFLTPSQQRRVRRAVSRMQRIGELPTPARPGTR
jgi:hypothetical protein